MLPTPSDLGTLFTPTRVLGLACALLASVATTPANAVDLLWCPVEVSEGPVASDLLLREALEARGRIVVRCDSLTGFRLADYDAIWVTLGVFPFTHPLTFDEGIALRDYVAGGGTLYLEGGDIWGYDALTPLNAIDGISASADGGSDLFTIRGLATESGIDLTDLAASYSGERSNLDHLYADLPGASVLFEEGDGDYGVGVLHEGAASGLADFRLLGLSYEFGGWDGDRTALLEGILIALGLAADCGHLGPAPPRCTLRPQGVQVTWANLTQYTTIEVRRDGETVAVLPGSVTSYLDVAPPAGRHDYTVYAEAGGECWWLSAHCRIDVPQPILFRRGDVDGNGGFDIVDAIRLLRALFVANQGLTCPDAGDVNDSGALDISDAISLLRHLFDYGAPPLPPFDTCGGDPTLDSLGACSSTCGG